MSQLRLWMLNNFNSYQILLNHFLLQVFINRSQLSTGGLSEKRVLSHLKLNHNDTSTKWNILLLGFITIFTCISSIQIHVLWMYILHVVEPNCISNYDIVNSNYLLISSTVLYNLHYHDCNSQKMHSLLIQPKRFHIGTSHGDSILPFRNQNFGRGGYKHSENKKKNVDPYLIINKSCNTHKHTQKVL